MTEHFGIQYCPIARYNQHHSRKEEIKVAIDELTYFIPMQVFGIQTKACNRLGFKITAHNSKTWHNIHPLSQSICNRMSLLCDPTPVGEEKS